MEHKQVRPEDIDDELAKRISEWSAKEPGFAFLTMNEVISVLACLANNPLVPSDDEAKELHKRLEDRATMHWEDMRDAIAEWGSRAFLKKTPEYPEELTRLIKELGETTSCPALCEGALAAAYKLGEERGKLAGSEK